MAVDACPETPSYVLNLMHAHELLQEYSLAIEVAIKFCRLTRYLKIKPASNPVPTSQVNYARQGMVVCTKAVEATWLLDQVTTPSVCCQPQIST